MAILLKRSNTPSDAPVLGDLLAGEIAYNMADARMFYRNESNQIIEFGFLSTVGVTTNATPRFDGSGWAESGVLVDGSDNMTGVNDITADGDVGAVNITASGTFTGDGSGLTGVIAASAVVSGFLGTDLLTQDDVVRVGTAETQDISGLYHTPLGDVFAENINRFYKLTQNQYDAIPVKDTNTVYIIVG